MSDMTGVRRIRLYRITAFITSIMLILGCFAPLYGTRAGAQGENVGVSITTFKVSPVSGMYYYYDENDEICYEWSPYASNPGHRFLYRLVYSFSGSGSIDTGGVRFTLPRSIIDDRNGDTGDKPVLTVPKLSQAGAANEYGYELTDENIVISNVRPVSAAGTGYIEVAYEMTKSSFSYIDGTLTSPVNSQLSISRNDDTVSAESTCAPVRIDTFAKVSYSRTPDPEKFYESWQSSWGQKPEGADDYYFIEWLTVSYVNATQPYDLTLRPYLSTGPNTVTSADDYQIAGYMLDGNDTYSNINGYLGLTKTGYRYDRVLTKHKKSTFEPLEQYRLYNNAVITIHPDDGIDGNRYYSSEGCYIYDTPVFVKPFGNWNSWLYGNTSWAQHFGTAWDVADRRLEELKNGTIDYINGDLKYCVYTVGMPYPRTLEENADEQDYENYGKAKVNYRITDDTFYYLDEITTSNEEITIPEGTEPIGGDDYEIESVSFRTKINDARFDERTLRFVMINGTYNEDDILYFDLEFNDSGEWVENAASWNLCTNEYTADERYVKSIRKGRIFFAPGCTGYRVRTSNAHYKTAIELIPYCKLKGSERILELTGDRDKAWLTNTAKTVITDKNGDEIFSKDIIARDYIIGYIKTVDLDKTITGISNSTVNKWATLYWKASLSESFVTPDGLQYVQQDGGTFYDLLPLGCEPDLGTLSVKANGSVLSASDYEVYAERNYRDTGRTLLRINIKDSFNEAVVTYSTVYTWNSMIDYGTLLLNSIAYQTGNDSISEGMPDNGGEITEHDLMKHLDLSSEGDRFRYTEHSASVDVPLAASLGLTKSVMSQGDVAYLPETSVEQDGSYSYSLRFASSFESSSKDIIFYDSLENYSDDEGHSDFRGTLLSVDVSQPEQKGAAPVIYYSSAEGLDLSEQKGLDTEYEGERLWKTAEEFGDISAARAVAIDLSKTADGEDFVLKPSSSAVVILNIKALSSDESTSDDPCAYNSVYLSNTVLKDDDPDDDEPGVNVSQSYISHQYTTVHYRIRSDIDLLKTDSSDSSVLIKGAEFTLSGVSDYGTSVEQTLATDKNGTLSFRDIEKGSYTLTETATPDDYFGLTRSISVTVNADGTISYNGETVDKGEYYNITNDPRIHCDVVLAKRDLVTNKYVSRAKFELSGTSDYGNDVSLYAVSQNGRLQFSNVEKGTYTLTEVEAPDGYIPSRTVFKVQVADTSSAVISIDTTVGEPDEDLLSVNSSGLYSIYNEPYHSFTLYKEGLAFGMPIEGAVFSLKGISDYGTEVSMTKTTRSNGELQFSGLEPGTYILKETEAPDDYVMDSTERAVTIDKLGNTSISGLEKDEYGAFVVTNKENTTVTIIKKWVGGSADDRYEDGGQGGSGSDTPAGQGSSSDRRNTAGAPDGTKGGNEDDNRTPKLPDIVISSDIPVPYAVFGGGNELSVLSTVKPLANIRSFAPFDGSDEEFAEYIDSGAAVRIDDYSTAYKIYAYFDSETGAVYWWSDARRVYLSDDSHYLWYQLTNCATIDVSGIDTSNVTDMSRMFKDCRAVTTLDLTGFNTSRVTNMLDMFYNCYELTSVDMSSFNTSKVLNMGRMFAECHSITEIDVSNFDTSRATATNAMFARCYALESMDLSMLDLSKTLSIKQMFMQDSKLKSVNMSGIHFDAVYSAPQAFRGCSVLEEIDFTDTEFSALTDISYMFYQCYELKSLDLRGFDTSGVTTMKGLFTQCEKLSSLDISSFDTSSCTDMYCMFYLCKSLESLDVSNFDTSAVKNMGAMFREMTKLKSLDLRNFDTRSCTLMDGMFYEDPALETLNITNFDTSAVERMNHMFYKCSSLSELDVSSFDTSTAVDMYVMFYNCSSLTELDLRSFYAPAATDFRSVFGQCTRLERIQFGNFDGSSCRDLSNMFFNCTALAEVDLSSFRTKSATNLMQMFCYCRSLRELDMTGFVLTNVTDSRNMFWGCSMLDTIYVSEQWDASGITSSGDMFNGCTSIEGSFGTTYDSAHKDKSYARPDGEEEKGYLTLSDVTQPESPPVRNSAVFGYSGTEEEPLSVLDRVCDLTEIKSFAKYDGDESFVEQLIESGDAAEIDNGAEGYPHIYGWLDNGTLYWWSKAKNVYLENSSRCLFRGLTDCTSIDLTDIRSERLTDMSYMFENCHALTVIDFTKLYASAVTTMKAMFRGCSSFTSFDLYFTPSALLDTSSMFEGCSSAESIIYKQKMSTVLNASAMYKDCTALKSVNKYVFSSTACTDMSYLFYGCKNLQSLSDLNFTTDNVTDMSYMFCGCESLTGINMRSFHTDKVTSMKAMFKDCKSMTGFLISGFDVSSVTDISEMFSGCSALEQLDMSSFRPAEATDMSGTFSGCISLKTIYAKQDVWTTEKLERSEGMFADCVVLKGGFGTEFDSEATDGAMACIDSETQQGYLTEKTAAHTSVTYHVTDDNCEVNTDDEDTWVFTFTGIDPGTPFYVWEDDEYGDYSSSSPRENYIQLHDNTAVIINTKNGEEPEDPEYGALKISKVVQGDNIPADDLDRSFTFGIELFDGNGEPLSGAAIYGGTAFNNGRATVKLKGGASVRISGIPAGCGYRISETAADGWESTSENAEGVIEADSVAEAVFTNTWTKEEEQKVSFTLKKIVEGNSEQNDEQYSFSISLTGLRPGAFYALSDGTTFTADTLGKAFVTVMLSDKQSVTVMDIPAGSGYRVTEAAGDYTSAYSITDGSGLGRIRQSNDFVTLKQRSLGTAQETADEGEDILITFTNTIDARQDISVSKTVINAAPDSSETFSFIMEITGLSQNETVYADGLGAYRADSSGRLTAEFLLRDGETAVFRDVPAGAYYTVTETANSYTASFTVEDRNGGTKIAELYKQNAAADTALSTSEETVNEGEDILITFTNRKEQRDLSISKLVDMSDGAVPYSSYSKLKFAFTVHLSALDPDRSYSMVYTSISSTGVLRTESFTADSDGKADIELTLTHGQICTIKDLDVGTEYLVTERGYQGYRSSYAISSSENAVIASPTGAAEAPGTELSTAHEIIDGSEYDTRIVFTNKFSAANYTLPNAGRAQNAAGAAVLAVLMLISWLSLAFVRLASKRR